MSGETTVTPGKTHDESSGEKTDLAKINLVSKPSVQVNEQAITSRELADGSVTSDKLGADVLNQINAEAIIGDGSITCAKMAPSGVCYAKRDTPWDDNYVQRDTIATTVGNYLRYVNTTGQTEEVTPATVVSDLGFGAKIVAGVLFTTAPSVGAISPTVTKQTGGTLTEPSTELLRFTFTVARADTNYLILDTHNVPPLGSQAVYGNVFNKTVNSFDYEFIDAGSTRDYPDSGAYTHNLIVVELI
jgi:hypothetical protein